LDCAPGELTLLYRAGSEGQLVLREELEEIARTRGAGLHFLLGPSDGAYDPSPSSQLRSSRGDPLAPQALRALVPDLAEHDVYLCGPPGMADAATASLLRAGVPEAHLHTELFRF
jgi:ferredoxin-NADP reductase